MEMRTTHNIGEYIRKNEERKNVHWRIKDGIAYFEMDGFFHPQEEFDYFYPKYQYKPFNEKGESPGKSYDR
jgi:hypothetical protein